MVLKMRQELPGTWDFPSQLESQSQDRAYHRPEFSCSVSLIEHTVKMRPKEEKRLNQSQSEAGEKGVTEDKMVGWHHRLRGHEFEHAVGDGEGQGSLACCSPWGHKESDTNERLNKNNRVRER